MTGLSEAPGGGGAPFLADLGGTLKRLDAAIEGSEENLFQLLLNRGYCNQRLACWRKALKARARAALCVSRRTPARRPAAADTHCSR